MAVRVLSSVPMTSSIKSLKLKGVESRARRAPEHARTSKWTEVSWSTENISRSGSSAYHVKDCRPGSRWSRINSRNTVTEKRKHHVLHDKSVYSCAMENEGPNFQGRRMQNRTMQDWNCSIWLFNYDLDFVLMTVLTFYPQILCFIFCIVFYGCGLSAA